MYFLGKGVEKDTGYAIVWLRKAADQGSGPAQVALSRLYSSGTGVPVNYHEAAHWAQHAAQQRDHAGEAALASLYEQGKGVPLNYIKAYRLYKSSFDGGNKQSKASMENLLRIMTPRQIAEAISSGPDPEIPE